MTDVDSSRVTTTTFVLGPIREPTKGLQASLVGMAGSVFSKRFLLARTRISIGRASDCDITIDDVGVSRRHAEVRRLGDHYVLVDCNSKNGTVVGDQRVDRAELRDGDFIRIGEAVFKFLRMNPIERQYHDELQKLSHEDPLTGAHNRRHAWSALEQEISRTSRYGGQTSLIVFDIDHFKKLNDTWGHPAGDAVLVELVRRVKAALRRSDTLARIGGEEFLVLLPETDALEAAELATRLRDAVAASPFGIGDAGSVPVTISLGVSDFGELMQSEASESGTGRSNERDAEDLALSANRFVALADAKLYEAKHLGRNRVAI